MFSIARTVVPYMGFSNGKRVYTKGRIFIGKAIVKKSSGRILRNLWNSVQRFRTFEYPGIKITLTIGGRLYTTHTDHEGYYTFDFILPQVLDLDGLKGDILTISLRISEKGYDDTTIEGELLIVRDSSSHIIVSDIDDTVMESYVSSPFKLKMLYNTFTKAPFQRIPVKGMVRLLESAHQSPSHTPIIYLSNSPWNIYDFIVSFLNHHGFPKGPIFLRDYGTQMITKKKTDPIHKMEMLHLFFSTFKDQKFILFGDSAECDIDYYLSMVEMYPEKVSAICIRDVGHIANRSRIQQLAKANKTPIFLSNDPAEFKTLIETILVDVS